MALEIDNVKQSQSISEASLFKTIPKEIVEELADYVNSSDDPLAEIGRLIEDVNRNISSKKKTASVNVAWNILGPEDEKKKRKSLDGFKLNSIERVLAYITILTLLYKCVGPEPEQKIEINQYFIQQYEDIRPDVEKGYSDKWSVEI